MFTSVRALTVIAAALLVLSGCVKPRSGYDPHLFVQVLGGSKQSIATPQGYGWVPSSNVDILLLGEPKAGVGEIYTDGSWRLVGTVHADSLGMFGFTGPFKFNIDRNICGFPPPLG